MCRRRIAFDSADGLLAALRLITGGARRRPSPASAGAVIPVTAAAGGGAGRAAAGGVGWELLRVKDRLTRSPAGRDAWIAAGFRVRSPASALLLSLSLLPHHCSQP